MSSARRLLSVTVVSALALALPVLPAMVGSTQAAAAQPKPGHTQLVPQVPRTNQPKITDGEVFDMTVIGNRIFVAGSFTGITATNGTRIAQAGLVAYNFVTGAVDTTFRPTFDGSVSTVEASPDGTKLFVGGTFNTVSGVTSRKVASLNLTTGAPVSTFKVTGATNNPVTAIAATNSTVYVGGRFTTINGVARGSLAALNASTGVVDPAFNLPITGGIGVNGGLTVQVLKLTHDDSKLMVVHTGRQIAGQDRYGVGFIDTATKTLLPWKTNLWQDNLPFVGGVQRVYGGDIAPNDQYFVVTSGSGGDRPPINDTAMAFPIAGGDNVQPLWISRHFDSVYSVAITEDAVYVGGHFQFEESPTAHQPWPGLDNVGYGTGQGLSGYGLGDDVVRRDHISALDPATGTALEWDPGSNSFEGNKAMLATPQGLFAGGDAVYQGTKNVGRIAFYDLSTIPAPTAVDTTITTPIEGRVVGAGVPFTITGTAKATSGVKRVQVEVQNRNTKQYLQDDGVTWGASNNFFATLATPGATTTTWSLPVTLTGNNPYTLTAKAYGNTGNDPTKATKKIESFGVTDQTPSTAITSPPRGALNTLSFTLTGTGTDDIGVNAVSLWFRDENNQYLQDDGTVGTTFNTFRVTPDVVGAPNATWSYDVTLPHEGTWRASATAVDTTGQSDLRSDTRDFVVSTTGTPPSLSITAPAAVTAPLTVPPVQVAPGGQLTFSGATSDATSLSQVLVSLRNSSTHESLAADGTWGTSVIAGNYRISPLNINATNYNWTYTTPFNLAPGQYTFGVRSVNSLGLTTRASLTVNVQVPGDAFPDTALAFTGTDQTQQTLQLNLSGTATDDKSVQAVRLSLYNNLTGQYVQTNGTLASSFALLNATLASPGATSTAFTLPVTLPKAGDYSVTAYAEDSSGQRDPVSTGATARYLDFPGDANPTFDPALGSPVTGTTFTNGRIVVSGRANDDVSMLRVEVAILNGTNQYMTSTGSFTPTETWQRAFLTSQGSPGSNFAYTSPVLPAGTYTVLERATDGYGKVGPTLTVTNIAVTIPANAPPVAHATVSCAQNVCTFDGRTSTDENVPALSYSWDFGGGITSSLPVPVRTFTSAGTFPVTLTVRDEWGATSSTTLSVIITAPPTNVAPTPAFVSSCSALACSVSGATTVDPNAGDVVTYSWNWGDASAASTGVTATHTYASTGTYTVTLTATDGWGKSATKTGTITLTEPGGNTAPVPTFTTACSTLTCSMNPSGTYDLQGDAIRYSWNFGDGTAASTLAAPTHTYAVGGTYTVTLTVTDGWNKSANTTRQITIP